MQVSQIPHTFQTAGPFNLGGGELLVIAVVLLVSARIYIPFGIFYVITLRNTLWKCAPESRTITTGKLWLLLIPFFSLGWHFVVVLNMAKSLRNEFARRNLPNSDPEPGQSLGLATCILLASGLVVPGFGLVLVFSGFICWILYWAKIAEYSRALDAPTYRPHPEIAI